MTTRLYRVEALLTCYVAADSEEEAKNALRNIASDVMEDSDIAEYGINAEAKRVQKLEAVPEKMHDSVPFGITNWECECWDLPKEQTTREDKRGYGIMHLPTCGYGLTVRELIAAQDRDRGIDGVTGEMFTQVEKDELAKGIEAARDFLAWERENNNHD